MKRHFYLWEIRRVMPDFLEKEEDSLARTTQNLAPYQTEALQILLDVIRTTGEPGIH